MKKTKSIRSVARPHVADGGTDSNMEGSCEYINPLKPNEPYRGRTAPLTSKRCILYIYSTNIGTEYFKHGINSPCFCLQNAVFYNSNIFGSYIIHILYTECAKI